VEIQEKIRSFLGENPYIDIIVALALGASADRFTGELLYDIGRAGDAWYADANLYCLVFVLAFAVAYFSYLSPIFHEHRPAQIEDSEKKEALQPVSAVRAAERAEEKEEPVMPPPPPAPEITAPQDISEITEIKILRRPEVNMNEREEFYILTGDANTNEGEYYHASGQG